MGSYRLLEHTADMGIEVFGESLSDLFIQAGRGLREMISTETQALPREERSVEVAGEDEGELLVNWLNEILFLFETGFFPVDFAISQIHGASVRGSVLGEPFDPARHPIEREVKAVTYHQLQVEKTAQGWKVTVFVDL
jgi:SHS2 domain-containing protein